MGKTSPGARASKLSEPMWTPSLELHTGHVAEGHDQRPDTRPIEVPACQDPLEESPCKTGGIHTRPASSRTADLEASLGEINRQNMDVGHALLLRTRPDGARWHLTMPDGGRIHPISSGPIGSCRCSERLATDCNSLYQSGTPDPNSRWTDKPAFPRYHEEV